jgi:hypothetical protein
MLIYLKDHIIDEINGAIEYMQKAVENKGAMCGETFMQMAKMETEHASALYKMFQKHEKPSSMSDKDYSMLLKEILDKFSDGMEKFESLKKMYYM